MNEREKEECDELLQSYDVVSDILGKMSLSPETKEAWTAFDNLMVPMLHEMWLRRYEAIESKE